MLPDTAEHAAQRRALHERLDAVGLTHRRDALDAVLKPAIALHTRDATPSDVAVGATRVGGEPDLPPSVPWPTGEEGPLLFVLQVDLAQAAPLDLEQRLPPDGLLLVFTDRWAQDVRVLHVAAGEPLERRGWAPTIRGPYVARGVDLRGELQPPPPDSAFVGDETAIVELDSDEHDAWWDDVWLDWRERSRPGAAGECGIHQLLGYTAAERHEEQGADEEVVVGFDSDDRADMQWGDVHTVWVLLSQSDLAARAWDRVRAAM
jgi:hypothetical protein